MTIPLNPGFETGVGGHPGKPANWTIVVSFGGWKVGDFSGGGAIPVSVERFDVGWSTSPYVYEVTGGTVALYDVGLTLNADTRETFGYWAQNHHYQWTVSLALQGTFNGGADNSEGFESGYGNDAYLYVLGPGDVHGLFTESFDPAGSYDYTVTAGTTGMFDLGTQPSEDFEEVFADVRFLVNPADTTTMTSVDALGQNVNHNMGAGFAVTLLSEGSLPAGVHEGAIYYVKDPGPDTFKLSLTIGGSAEDMIDFGSGRLFVHADERKYWTHGG